MAGEWRREVEDVLNRFGSGADVGIIEMITLGVRLGLAAAKAAVYHEFEADRIDEIDPTSVLKETGRG